MRVLFATVLLTGTLWAKLDNEISRQFDFVAGDANIEKTLLLALAKTESAFNKYTIGIVANNPEMLSKFLKINNVKHLQGKEKRSRFFSITATSKMQAEEFFYKFKYFVKKYPYAIKTYDLGLMQINISNIKNGESEERKYLFDIKANSRFGAEILRQCYGKFKNAKYAIECYNKGTNSKKFGNFEYFSRVVKNYKELKRKGI